MFLRSRGKEGWRNEGTPLLWDVLKCVCSWPQGSHLLSLDKTEPTWVSLQTSSCSALHPESVTHHLYLQAANSVTPPISVSNCKSSQAVPEFTDISVVAVCVSALKPNYWFPAGKWVVTYILYWVVHLTCAWVLQCFLKKELQVSDCTTSRAVWIPI